MENRCQNCKHWKPTDSENLFGDCDHISVNTCAPESENNNETSFMHVKLGDGDWYGDYFVGRNFGCIHFESKVNIASFTYKFRAECLQDVFPFINSDSPRFQIISVQPLGDGVPDILVELASNWGIDQIKNSFLANIDDSHVMAETINYSHLYTGDRDYSSNSNQGK